MLSKLFSGPKIPGFHFAGLGGEELRLTGPYLFKEMIAVSRIECLREAEEETVYRLVSKE